MKTSTFRQLMVTLFGSYIMKVKDEKVTFFEGFFIAWLVAVQFPAIGVGIETALGEWGSWIIWVMVTPMFVMAAIMIVYWRLYPRTVDDYYKPSQWKQALLFLHNKKALSEVNPSKQLTASELKYYKELKKEFRYAYDVSFENTDQTSVSRFAPWLLASTLFVCGVAYLLTQILI